MIQDHSKLETCNSKLFYRRIRSFQFQVSGLREDRILRDHLKLET